MRVRVLIFCHNLEQESSARAKSNGIKVKNNTRKGSNSLMNGSLNMPIEDVAAIRIQTAFRAYKVCLVWHCVHEFFEIDSARLIYIYILIIIPLFAAPLTLHQTVF